MSPFAVRAFYNWSCINTNFILSNTIYESYHKTIAYLLLYYPPMPIIWPPNTDVPSIFVNPVLIESISSFF